MRKMTQSKRRHFHNSKTSMMSHVNLSGGPQTPDQTLVDDSASAMVGEMGASSRRWKFAAVTSASSP
jgi:hypothetical protein